MFKIKCVLLIFAKLLAGYPVIADAARPLAFDSVNVPVGGELKLTRITPKGDDVPIGRQIVFQFDRPVVAAGRMNRESSEIPVKITPALNCEWRWLNTSALSCNLTEDDQLKYATYYRITVNPGIKASDGAVMNTRVTHEFITARPKIKYTRFQTWRSPGLPKIRLTFNQPVSRSSVSQSLYFSIKGRTDKYQINVEPDKNDRQTPFILPLPGESLALYSVQAPQQADGRLTQKGEEARHVWVVSPRRELPFDTPIDLSVDPGLVSAWGRESGIESRKIVNFQTFPEFRFLGVRCSVLQQSLR